MAKTKLYDLIVGQRIWAKVEEIQAHKEILINHEGDLIRVLNLADQVLKPGDLVCLEVEALRPLKFRIVPQTKNLRGSWRSVNIEA